MWFCLGDEKAVRFSLYEFTLIIGLNPTGEDENQSQMDDNNRSAHKYFPASSKVMPKQLNEAFEKEIEDMDGKYKLGLVLIYKIVPRSKEKNTSIDLQTLNIGAVQ